jgi:signal transduction histidine kinase
METARETGRALDERFHLRKDGSRFYVSGSLSPLYRNGKLDGYVKIARDLTERKQAEEALRRAHDELEQRVEERTRELREANALLLDEIAARKQAEAQLRQMTSRLTMAEQEERRRISQILHDDLQQLLYAIQLKVVFMSKSIEAREWEQLREYVQPMIAWIDDAIMTTRRLTVDLNPPVLQGEGLTDALNWLVTQMTDLHGLRVEIETEQNFPIDDEAMRLLLFQIVRELLFNVIKHAQTDRATVTLWEEAGRLIIRVSDQGRGFRMGAVEQGFGLFSIRERLGLFGGRMEILSQPGEGTQITIYTPVRTK